jgi:predicted phage terminase large subunit-like protein
MATRAEVKRLCEGNFFAFLRLLNPLYEYGDIHEEGAAWLSDKDASARQLALWPRAHLKSHILAGFAAWRITKDPWLSIVYLSAGEDLAKDQIYAIKNIMTSDTYRRYWPEMINLDEGQREQWSAYSFNVDHPERKRRGIRDHTIIVKTVKSNAIGLHCDLLLLDDVVIPRFADTITGRGELSRQLAQYTSILNPNGEIKAVGTRYNPADAYQDMIDTSYPIWNKELGVFQGTKKAWDLLQFEVEGEGNGTGDFIWPRTQDTTTGQAYGFDHQTLAIIKADYEARGELSQFYCQYYNDPNAIELQRINRGSFQYYDRKFLSVVGGKVAFNDNQLKVFAAMDVAWTDSNSSDYTAIVVIGMDHDSNIYVLDATQFKTSTFDVYYNEVINLHYKWGFKKIRIETNAGGLFVKQELERLIKQNGNTLSVDGKATVKNSGKKGERHAATLEWRYDAQKMWHYRGGHNSELEEQIVLDKPKHDDLVDALVAAIEISKPPGKGNRFNQVDDTYDNVYYDNRFGGRRGRVA